MATRLYISNDPVDQTLPAVQGTWTTSTNTDSGKLWVKAGGAATAAFTVSATGVNEMLARFQSPPFATATTFTATTDTVNLVTGAAISVVTNTTVVHRIHIFIVESDGVTIRGTPLANSTITGTAWTATATGRGPTSAIALGSTVTAQPGDRIVIEIGYNRTGSSTSSRVGTINYGNTGGTDLVLGNTSVTTNPGWVEFSANFINNFAWDVNETESTAVSDTPTIVEGVANDSPVVEDDTAVSDTPTITTISPPLKISVTDAREVGDFLLGYPDNWGIGNLLFGSSYAVQGVGGASSNSAVGQSFTVGDGYSVSDIVLHMNSNNTPIDGVYVELASGSITGPTIGTSNTVPAASFTLAYKWIDFKFSTPVSLSSGTQYFFRVFRTGATDTINVYNIHWAGGQSTSFVGGGDYLNLNGVWAAERTGEAIYFQMFATGNYLPSPVVIAPLKISTVEDITTLYDGTFTLNGAASTNLVAAVKGGTGVSGETLQKTGQNFQALSSSINAVQIWPAFIGTPTDSLVVEIRDVPDGTVLGSVTVAAASISSNVFNTFTFASPISVTPGANYFLQLSRTGVRDTSNWYAIRVSRDSYPSTGTTLYTGYTAELESNSAWADLSGSSASYTLVTSFQYAEPVINIQANQNFSVTDTTAVADSVTVFIPILVPSVEDDTAVTDTPTIELVSFVSVTDSSVVSDTPTIVANLALSVSTNDWAHVVDYKLSQLVDSNSVEAVNGGSASSGETGQESAQSFVAVGSFIDYVILKVFRAGTPSDNYLVDIVSVQDGTSLGNVTIAATAPTSQQPFTFTFSSPVPVTPGNSYFIQISRSGARDTSNLLSFYAANNRSVYTSGQVSRRSNNVWSTVGSVLYFEIGFEGLQSVEIVSLPSVTDSSAVSDTPTLSLTSFVSVTDSSGVTDTPTLEIFSFVSVTDSTAVSDTPTLEPFSFVSVTDSSAVSDTPIVEIISLPSVTDSTAVTSTPIVETVYQGIVVTDSTATSDAPTIEIFGLPSVTDSTAVSDTPSLEVFSYVLVTDSTAVTDTSTAFLPYLTLSVQDSTTMLDVPQFVEELSFFLVSDSTVVSDTPTLAVSSPQVVVEDDTAVSDSPIVEIVSLASVSDSTVVGESVTMEVFSFVSVTDATAVSDVPTVEIVLQGINVTDSTAAADTPTIEEVDLISVTDSTGVAESVSLVLVSSALQFSVSDSTVVADAEAALEMFSFVAVTDSSAVVDSTTVESVCLVVVEDDTATSDSVQVSIPIILSTEDDTAVTDTTTMEIVSFVLVIDTTAVSDAPVVFLPYYAFQVEDDSAVSDTQVVLIPILLVSVEDDTTVSDAAVFEEEINYVDQGDTTAVSDTPAIFLPYLTLRVEDDTSVSDIPTLEMFSFISVTDTTPVSDSPVVEPFSFISVTDTAAVTDTDILELVSSVVANDSTVVSEDVTLEEFSYIAVSDSTAVTDTPTIEILSSASVSDSAAVSDQPTVEILSFMLVTDSTIVLDTSEASIQATLSATDTSVVTDVPTLGLFSFVSVTDSTTVSDTPTIFLPYLTPQVSDTTTATDTPTILVPILTLSVSDSSAISDSPVFEEEISFVSQGDATVVTDAPTIFLPYYTISVADSTAVSDTDSVVLQSYLSVTDTSAVSATPTLEVFSFVSATDSSAVSDTPMFEMFSFVSVQDSTVVSDTVSVESIDQGVNVSDSTGVSETVKLELFSYIAVTDTTPVTDTPTFTATTSVDAADAVTMSESVAIEIIDQGANVTDTTAVSDTPTLSLTSYIVVVDSTAASDTPVLDLISSVSVTDSTSVGESVVVEEVEEGVSVTDSTAVTDSATLRVSVNVTASDSAAVTDTPVLNVTVNVTVTELTTVSESLAMFISAYGLLVTDATTVTDTVVVAGGANHTVVQDTVAISDSVVMFLPTLVLQVADSTTVLDTLDIEPHRQLLVTQGVSIIESVSLRVARPVNRRSNVVQLGFALASYALKLQWKKEGYVVDRSNK